MTNYFIPDGTHQLTFANILKGKYCSLDLTYRAGNNSNNTVNIQISTII